MINTQKLELPLSRTFFMVLKFFEPLKVDCSFGMNVDFEISRVDCTVLYIAVGSFSIFAHAVSIILISVKNWPRGYKTFFMLNSVEHEIFPAQKYENAKNCWHFNSYEREK